jgi:hypothetical protein
MTDSYGRPVRHARTREIDGFPLTYATRIG